MWFECWAQGRAGSTGLCLTGSCEGGRKAFRGGGEVFSLAPDSVPGAVYRLRCCCNLVFLLFQSALLDFYLKTILMSKTKPQKHVLVRQCLELLVMLSHRQHCPVLSALSPLQDSCSPLLRYMSHAEFKDSVLPTLQKSLLRSPENVIESESVIPALLCQKA